MMDAEAAGGSGFAGRSSRGRGGGNRNGRGRGGNSSGGMTTRSQDAPGASRGGRSRSGGRTRGGPKYTFRGSLKKRSVAQPSTMEIQVVGNLDDLSEHEVRAMCVFQNDLIFETIGAHLSHGDFQALSLVSKRMFHVARSNRQFIDTTVFNVNEEGFRKKAYGMKHYPWKSVRISTDGLTIKPTRNDVLSRILHPVEELEILQNQYSVKVPTKLLMHFLTNSPELKSLELDYALLNRKITNVLEKQPIIQKLATLQKFCINTGKAEVPYFIDGHKLGENIRALLNIPWQLHTLHIEKINFDTDMDEVCVGPLVELVEKNRETVRDLILHESMMGSTKMNTLICPVLEKLQVKVCQETEPNLVAFLQNAPPLTVLSIHHRSGIRKDLISVIQAKCSRLAKLSIRSSHFILDLAPVPVQPPQLMQEENYDEAWVVDPPLPDTIPLDLSFLGGISTLTEFDMVQKIRFHHHDRREFRVTVAGALSALPSAHVKSLSLCGMPHGWIGDPTLAGIAAFSRFQDLTSLSMLKCEDTLNDEILQFFFANFNFLKVFRLSGARNITAAGLTGVNVHNGTDSGISLRNLTGLIELALVDCSNWVAADYVTAIRFNELAYLDLRPHVELPVENLLEIIRHNLCLRKLCTTEYDQLGVNTPRVHIKTQVKEMEGTRLSPMAIEFNETLRMRYPMIGRGHKFDDPDDWSSSEDDDDDDDQDWSYDSDFSGGDDGDFDFHHNFYPDYDVHLGYDYDDGYPDFDDDDDIDSDDSFGYGMD